GRAIDGDDRRQLTLLHVLLHPRAAGTGGDVPVDQADIVAGCVLAGLGELDPGAPEDAAVFAGEARRSEAAAADLDAADTHEDIARDGHGLVLNGRPGRAAEWQGEPKRHPGLAQGISTPSSTRVTMSSGLMARAS